MSWAVFNLVAQQDVEALGEELARSHLVRVVDAADVGDGRALRERFGDALGFAANGWDSFADDVWTALLPDDEEDADKIALLWSGADALVDRHLDDFLTAFEILLGVARSAYEHEIDVTLFLLGAGKSFRRLRDFPTR